MTNFTRFLSDPQLAPFAEVAETAERVYGHRPGELCF